MNNTAAKKNPITETHLYVVSVTKWKSSIMRLASRIHGAFVGVLTPRFDHDAWRRLEFKNEFIHERRHDRLQWRI